LCAKNKNRVRQRETYTSSCSRIKKKERKRERDKHKLMFVRKKGALKGIKKKFLPLSTFDKDKRNS